MLSRFPADTGIMAESRRDGTIDVKFIERVFMKNAKSYKAVVYEGTSRINHFWDGFATDKQINNGIRTISDYWVRDFLLSDFLINSALGSKRLAETIMKAIKDAPNLDVKHELVSSSVLANNLRGQNISIRTFGERLTLSPDARGALRRAVRNRQMWEETFALDIEEFRQNAPFKTVILDTGVTLSAPSHRFDEIITAREFDNTVSYSTEGRIIDEKIRKTT